MNGLIGLIFAATGPVAVILAVGRQGGLSPVELASWIFGVFFLNGILTVLACWLYQQPLAVAHRSSIDDGDVVIGQGYPIAQHQVQQKGSAEPQVQIGGRDVCPAGGLVTGQ